MVHPFWKTRAAFDVKLNNISIIPGIVFKYVKNLKKISLIPAIVFKYVKKLFKYVKN